VVEGAWQCITFVNPKGIVHLDKDSPKLAFFETVKEIEAQLGDRDVVLNAFIVAGTPSDQVRWMTKAELNARHVLFIVEDNVTYIGTMFDTILGALARRRM
jgi:hypothetical protein